MEESDYKLEDWKDWENIACRIPIKTELEKAAKKDHRNPTNFLERILCNALGIEVPDGVGKKK